MGNLFRKIRGAIGNAFTWAVAWFGGSFVLFGALSAIGIVPPIGLGFLVRLALSVGATGFLAGCGFSLFLGTTYRYHRLEELKVGRIALGGGILAGTLAPGLSAVAIGLGASGVGLGFLVANAIGAAVFGGITAGGTVALAQRSAKRLEGGVSSDDTELPTGRHGALGQGAGPAS